MILDPSPPPLGRVWLQYRGGPRDGEQITGVAVYDGWEPATAMHLWTVTFPLDALQLTATGAMTGHMDELPGRTAVSIFGEVRA